MCNLINKIVYTDHFKFRSRFGYLGLLLTFNIVMDKQVLHILGLCLLVSLWICFSDCHQEAGEWSCCFSHRRVFGITFYRDFRVQIF